jgi:predicted MFS family arabinose efflux permease
MFNQVTSDTMIQTTVASATLGRVYGAFSSVITVAMLAGALITGPLIATIGPRGTTIVFAAIALIILLGQFASLHSPKRSSRHEPTLAQLSESL